VIWTSTGFQLEPINTLNIDPVKHTMEAKARNVQATYDSIAEEYAKRVYGELPHKPLDRALLDRFAAQVGQSGKICDLGCGPGHVASYLAQRGADVVGIDLSPRMVEIARRLNPDIQFMAGDIFRLDVEDGGWAGIAAMYSIIHIPFLDLPPAFREMHRALRSDGWLLVGFHAGTDTIHLDQWWSIPVSIDAYFFEPDDIVTLLEHAGLTVRDVIRREPYPEVEYPSRRAYILAQKKPRASTANDKWQMT
jgi:SAM-dependent methyltransferase